MYVKKRNHTINVLKMLKFNSQRQNYKEHFTETELQRTLSEKDPLA